MQCRAAIMLLAQGCPPVKQVVDVVRTAVDEDPDQSVGDP